MAQSRTWISKVILLYKQIKFSRTNNDLLRQLHLSLYTLGLPKCVTWLQQAPDTGSNSLHLYTIKLIEHYTKERRTFRHFFVHLFIMFLIYYYGNLFICFNISCILDSYVFCINQAYDNYYIYWYSCYYIFHAIPCVFYVCFMRVLVLLIIWSCNIS